MTWGTWLKWTTALKWTSGLGVKCKRWRRNVRFAMQSFCVPFVAIFSITQWCFRAATVAAKTVLSITGESVSRDSVHCADNYLLIILGWVGSEKPVPSIPGSQALSRGAEVHHEERTVVLWWRARTVWDLKRMWVKSTEINHTYRPVQEIAEEHKVYRCRTLSWFKENFWILNILINLSNVFNLGSSAG